MAAEYRVIARLTKAFGNKGKVVAVPVDGLPFLLKEGMQVAIVPPVLKQSRFHTVDAVSENAAGQLLALSEVTTQDLSEELVGRFVLVNLSELPEDVEYYDPQAYIGMSVYDAQFGHLGEIVEVMQGPANDVWVIHGHHGEILFPAVEELIVGLSDDTTIEIAARLEDLVGYEGGQA